MSWNHTGIDAVNLVGNKRAGGTRRENTRVFSLQGENHMIRPRCDSGAVSRHPEGETDPEIQSGGRKAEPLKGSTFLSRKEFQKADSGVRAELSHISVSSIFLRTGFLNEAPGFIM